MGSKTPMTDAATYMCDEGSVLRVCDGLTEVAPAGLASRLESALAVAEEALTRISRAKPDQLDHAKDVAIIERASRISGEALRAIEQIKGGV